MSVRVLSFSPDNSPWIQPAKHFRELANYDYLGVFYEQGPQLVDSTGQQSPLSPFYGWYLFRNSEYYLRGDAEYLQSKLPLASPGELEFCIELLNDAHQNHTATPATFTSELWSIGTTVAANAHIDGIGDIVLINKVHPFSCRISPRLNNNLIIYGDTSFGWCYPPDAEDLLLEFLHV